MSNAFVCAKRIGFPAGCAGFLRNTIGSLQLFILVQARPLVSLSFRLGPLEIPKRAAIPDEGKDN